MSNEDYFKRWLKMKEQMRIAFAEDQRLQELASAFLGIKPQGTAVELVARVYCKYCDIYNKLCDCYDQMHQVQRRPFIKKIIDAVTCRLMELKVTLEEVEAFEFTYPDNALQQLLMVPQDVEVLCPFHYPFEIRQEEMQYLIDEILIAGNRLGDPTPTPSEIERKEQERLEEEERIREEKEAEIKRKMAMGEDISEAASSVQLSPQEIEEQRLLAEYNERVNNIQRMERSRCLTLEKTHKFNKDVNLYLELAGLKKPQAREALRIKAAKLIQMIYRRFMETKREHIRDYNLKSKLGMIIPSWSPPSAKLQLEKVKEKRREFRRIYYQKWLEENLKENARVLRLREGDIMEDISAEIRQWFREWYNSVRLFDEYPWPDEGGSILVVKGETFTIEEYVDWRTEEDKRLKAEAGSPKSKEQIKAEKLAAKEEKKRLEAEAKIREAKRLLDYKKSRMNPDGDPGIYLMIGQQLQPVSDAWELYQNQWKDIDTPDAPLEVLKGFIKELVTENAYKDVQFKLRPIVDDMMRLELNMLKNALKIDYQQAGIAKPPQSKKRKKPKKIKPPKPDKLPPARMFQMLVDEGIVRKYPKTTLDDYWGDRNYASADTRAILWTPKFPSQCIGDVKEQIRLRCLLAMGCSCPNAARSHLIIGPKSSGKRTLAYAIATETNSILIDLSPFNVYDKFPGPANLKIMFQIVNRISRLMQPTVILVDNADKMFYKTVPKEEKLFDPTRLQKDFFKEIIKPIIVTEDKILVIGTASEPWLSRNALMYKAFPSTILIPRTDYGSISFILSKMLMKYHGMDREFDVHCVAQALRGYDINSIKKGVENLMNGRRQAQLYYKPLEPMEVVASVLDADGVFTGDADFEMFKDWYHAYSPWGTRYFDYMQMLESQLIYKLKAEKKKK